MVGHRDRRHGDQGDVSHGSDSSFGHAWVCVRNRLCLQRTTRIREAQANDHPCFSSLFHPRPDAHADAAEHSHRCMSLLTVATSFAERGLGEVDPGFADRRPRTSSTERTSNNALTTCYFWSDVLTFSVVLSAERSEQSLTTSAVTYIHKYMSKPHCVVSVRPHCPAKWHAQARMLSCALPMDVVRVIGGHICEHAAVMLQKRIRRAVLQSASHGVCHACILLVRHRREPGVHVEAGRMI